MEYEFIRKLIEKKLIEEIGNLDSGPLELIGNNVISIEESKALIHHGLNKDYQPVGHTVDSFSDNSKIIGEYSIDKKYFDDSSKKDETIPKYEKIENDINHALGHGTDVEKIYLISSQEEPPSFRADFNQTHLAQEHSEKIILLDSRRLAKYIYDHSVKSPQYAGFYRQFFPGFSNDLDNYEYYGKVPARCNQHISDTGIIDVIQNHFLKNKICILHGLSGVGKTQAAIDFIHHVGKDFENYIWISGDDWKPDTSLNSIHRTRGGAPINVAGVFNSSKTILIIDSLERIIASSQIEELNQGFTKGGIILITSQIADINNPLYLAMPSVSETTAIHILGQDAASISDESLAFIKICKFSPLILATTRNIIEQGGINRHELYKEILDSPEDLSGNDGSSVLRKILSKLDEGMSRALKKVANSGVSVNDLTFLRRFIGNISCTNLQRLSILTSTNIPGISKIHDLVCIAARDRLSYSEISEELSEYIAEKKGVMEPTIIRQIHLCYYQLSEEDKLRGKRLPDWITYALLQVEGPVKKEIYKDIYPLDIKENLSLASVMCIIDAKEVFSFTIQDGNERNNYYKKCAEDYAKALEVFSSKEIKEELLHHQGKALRRCGEYKAALDCFTDLLNLNPDLYAAHGQIAHLGIQKHISSEIRLAGEKSMMFLVKSLVEGKKLPLRVALASLSKLRSYKIMNKDISQRPEDVGKLGEIIAMSALEKFGQFYESFLAFTSMFSYHHGVLCIKLSETLSEMLTISPDSSDKDEWVSACEALSNLSVAAKKENKYELASKLVDASLMFADKLIPEQSLKSFDARAIAKTYTTAGFPEKALECIDKVPKDKMDHWVLYRKCEAELAATMASESLETAAKALKLAQKDGYAKSIISIYHDLKSQSHNMLNDIDKAMGELELAIKECSDTKYKSELESRLEKLKN